jgi:hypothetical protein
MTESDSNSDSILLVDTKEEIKQLNVNMARLRPELRLIIREDAASD